MKAGTGVSLILCTLLHVVAVQAGAQLAPPEKRPPEVDKPQAQPSKLPDVDYSQRTMEFQVDKSQAPASKMQTQQPPEPKPPTYKQQPPEPKPPTHKQQPPEPKPPSVPKSSKGGALEEKKG
jgi:outer membrane biosynthesis protein TonB